MINTQTHGVCGDRGIVDIFTFNTKLSDMSDTANQRILHRQNDHWSKNLMFIHLS